MIEKNKILTEEELPIPVPSTDEAWKAMLKKLEEDNPEPVLIVGKSRNPLGWIIGGLLLLIAILWFGWFSPNKKSIDGEEKTAAVSKNESNNNSTNSSNLNSDKEKNKTDQNSNSLENSNANSNSDLSRNSTDRNSINAKSSLNEKNSVRKSNRSKSLKKLNSNKKIKKSKSNSLNQSDNQVISLSDEELLKYSSINFSLLSSGAIKKPLFPQMKISKKDEPEPVQNSYWLIEAGLEWGLPVPFSSARNIMDGPNGSFQPYRILLPGAWIRLEAGKHSMSLGVNPFYSALMPSYPFERIDSVFTTVDTVGSYGESKTLHKTFGISASFEYNYGISDRWWIGAGVQANWWSNGLVGINNEVKKVPTNGSPATLINHRDERSITDEEWNKFSKSQIGLTAQFFYRKKPWNAGIRFIVPFTPLSNSDAIPNQLRAEFLFRIKLIDWRIKQ